MRLTSIFAAFSLLIPLQLRADVEVLNHPLEPGAAYTVPEGKTLLLQGVVFDPGGAGNPGLSIQIPGASFAFGYSGSSSLFESQRTNRSVYLKEGTTLTAAERSIVLLGRVSTEDELYASTSPASKIDVSEDSASVTVFSKSTRPVKFSFQESTDLIDWRRAVVENASTSKSSATVEVQKTGERNYVRAKAKKIPVDKQG